MKYPLAEINVNNSQETASKISLNTDLIVSQKEIEESETQTFTNFVSEDAEKGFSHNSRLLFTRSWKYTDAFDLSIYHGNVISLMRTSNPTLWSRIDNFRVRRFNVRLTMVAQGNSLAAGRLIIYAIPGREITELNHNTRTNCRIVPHIIIDPSKNATYELLLPFCSDQGAYDLSDLSNWKLYSRVYDVLEYSGVTGDQRVEVNVMASLEDVHLSGKIIPTSNTFSALEDATKSIQDNLVPVVTKLSPYLTLASKGAKATALALKTFGFSKPNVLEYGVSRLNTAENYSQTSGSSKATVLGSSQLPASSIFPRIAGGTSRDMELSYMLGFPAYVGRYESTSNHVVGQAYPPMSLNLASMHNVLGSGCATYSNPALFTVLANSHLCASGSLIINVEFITSVFTRGSYLVAWSPDGLTTPHTMANAMAFLENTVVQVSGNTSVSVEVPYKSPTIAGFNFGTLYVYLMSPVVGNNVSAEININVLLDCSKVTFHTPMNYDQVDFVPTSNDWVDSPLVSFGKSNGDPDVFLGGDSPKVVKDLTSRMGFVVKIVPEEDKDYLVGPVWPSTPNILTRATFLDIFRTMFFGSRGSIRYSMFFGSNKGKVRTSIQRDSVPEWKFITSIASSNKIHAFTEHNLAVESSVDIVVPYLHVGNFVSIMDPAPSTLKIISYLEPGELLTNPVEVYMASGDDFVFSNFIGVPTFSYY